PGQRQLPADHHADRPPPVPGRRRGPPLSRALGDRVRVFRPAAHPARRPRAALRRPARPGTGDLGPAHPLPAAAHGYGHRHRDPPGTDPDRASFTTAMEAARDQLTAAAGLCPDRPAGPAFGQPGPADLPGAIGRALLPTFLPAPRPRYSARKVKCATSRYLNRDDSRPAHPTTITAIDIAITTPRLDLKPGRTHRDRS